MNIIRGYSKLLERANGVVPDKLAGIREYTSFYIGATEFYANDDSLVTHAKVQFNIHFMNTYMN